MIDIPDAPWIRDAEINGMPEPEDFTCPICGSENPEDFYFDTNGDLVGCSDCITMRDAYDYWYDNLRES